MSQAPSRSGVLGLVVCAHAWRGARFCPLPAHVRPLGIRVGPCGFGWGIGSGAFPLLPGLDSPVKNNCLYTIINKTKKISVMVVGSSLYTITNKLSISDCQALVFGVAFWWWSPGLVLGFGSLSSVFWGGAYARAGGACAPSAARVRWWLDYSCPSLTPLVLLNTTGLTYKTITNYVN